MTDFKDRFAELVDKASEALARSRVQKNPKLTDLYNNLAQAYLRLAELTERHNSSAHRSPSRLGG
jgi:hypothetical protein